MIIITYFIFAYLLLNPCLIYAAGDSKFEIEREVHDHVRTGDGHLEQEGRVLYSMYAQAEQAFGQDLIL